ncbi:MAG: hypothetical protein PHX58_10535 [Desulfovibrio sp.]|jgi:hypothetical protein|nr:hypothetical protein [Desulfovibrio sp.]
MLERLKQISWEELGRTLYRLFKPKFYNRITWTIVLAGLAIMSAPFFERVAEAILKRYFDLTFNGDLAPIYGLCLVGIGLLYNAICKSMEIKAEHRPHGPSAADRHDGALFQRFCELLPPHQVIHFSRDHDFGGAFSTKKMHPYSVFINNWQAADYEFQDEFLERSKRELLILAAEFFHLLAYKTYSYGSTDFNRVFTSDATFEEEITGLKNAKVINQAATDFYERYDQFVREARRNLLARGVSLD